MATNQSRLNQEKETKNRLPIPISSETLSINGVNYTVLRFPKWDRYDFLTYPKRPNLMQAIEITKSIKGQEMLTKQDAENIIKDDKLKREFKNIIKMNESTYIRDPENEELESSTCLANYEDPVGGFDIYYRDGNIESELLILKSPDVKNMKRK